MMALAMTILHVMMDPKEARIVATIHDQILFEIREDRVDYWVPIIREVMENLPLKKKFGADITIPITVDITIEQHWAESQEVAA